MLRLWLMAFDHGFVDTILGEALNVPNLETITETRERDRETLLARATGAADTMDVILRLHWQAIVDDVRDAGDVDAARGHVRCDQNFGAAIT